MFYSKKLNILFIACPKTGSRSVEEFFSALDPQGEKHRLTLDSKVFTSADLPFGHVGHAKAIDLKMGIGEKYFNELHTLGFARHPLDKLVATYSFNKKLSMSSLFKRKKNKKSTIIRSFISRIMAKLLPFHIWAFFFPMKTSREYFIDSNGNTIVDFIGRTSHLGEDLKLACKQFGIPFINEVPHINRSNHRAWEEYYKNKTFKKIIQIKYSKDLQFYSEVEKKLAENDHFR